MKTKEEQGIELLKDIIYEKCVLCGVRKGAGQLCDECGKNLNK